MACYRKYLVNRLNPMVIFKWLISILLFLVRDAEVRVYQYIRVRSHLLLAQFRVISAIYCFTLCFKLSTNTAPIIIPPMMIS